MRAGKLIEPGCTVDLIEMQVYIQVYIMAVRVTMPLTHTRLAIIGFILTLAPLYFVAANVMEYEIGVPILSGPLEYLYADPRFFHWFNIFSPILFLGGLSLALLSNLLPIVRCNVTREAGGIAGTITVKTRLSNLAIVGLSGLLLTVLIGYVLVENIAHAATG